MDFADWQLEKLREGLLFYRDVHASNGRLPSWESMATRIQICPALAEKFKRRTDIEAIKGEALRRFAKRISVPEPWHCQDLKTFLLDAKALQESDFVKEVDNVQEIMAVHGALANKSEFVKRLLSSLPTKYVSHRTISYIEDNIELSFVLDRSGTFFRVEEKAERKNTDPADKDYYRKDKYQVFNGRRTGYGFLTTDLHLMSVYLRGGAKNNFIHYVEVMPPSEIESFEKLRFIRSGANFDMPKNLEGDDLYAAALNFYAFEKNEVSNDDISR